MPFVNKPKPAKSLPDKIEAFWWKWFGVFVIGFILFCFVCMVVLAVLIVFGIIKLDGIHFVYIQGY